MTTKRKSLADGFRATTAEQTAPPEAKTESAPPPPPERKEKRASTRAGKKPVTAFLSPEAAAQLKAMAAMELTTQEALLIEAINDLFQKRGKGQIA